MERDKEFSKAITELEEGIENSFKKISKKINLDFIKFKISRFNKK